MRLSGAALVLLAACGAPPKAAAFAPGKPFAALITTPTPSSRAGNGGGSLSVAAAVEEDEATETDAAGMTYGDVNSLTFRQLQRDCRENGLPAVGNTAALRGRLLEFYGIEAKKAAADDDDAAAAAAAMMTVEECDPDIEFCDESDPDFDFKSLRKEIMSKASVGHWKAATRKLKRLSKNYETPERPVDAEVYLAVLTACAEDRLHGARASEPARKILEEMSARGYGVPKDVANGCIANSLGIEEGGKHEGCGGVDTALAMLAALESSPGGTEGVTMDSYGSIVSALAKDGAVEEAILLLRAMVVEKSFTPPLSTFADVAEAGSRDGKMGESVLQVLTLAKAAGYELDTVASAQVGRELLASAVIAAEQMDNLALGLRLLTAAGKAEGCAPDRGDDLVASSSKAAQRATMLIHKRAIDRAVEDDSWNLAVKLLELMPQRSLTPATSVWRKVVTTCAKNQKSRKATAILLDWVKLSDEGKAVKPPVSVFNTVVNACEICGEEELTLKVLDTMKQTHDTEGNIITTNIAMKRLAKLGNPRACEGIIIGMLQSGIEPNVVSYTTAIGACATEGSKDAAFAYEWLNRMRSRNVPPNFHTYNTALAACLDGKLESTVLGSTIATEMMADVDLELEKGLKGSADYRSTMPDAYTKVLARSLMKQLRENWRAGDINMTVAKATVRVPLLRLVDFDKSEEAKMVKEKVAAAEMIRKASAEAAEGEDMQTTERDDTDLEYSLVNKLHKDSHRIAEV